MLSLVQLTVAWATLFVVGTDLLVASPPIPIISDDFQVSVQGAGMIVTAFALGYVVAAPVFGHLADRAGRRRALTWCLVAFAGALLGGHMVYWLGPSATVSISLAGTCLSFMALWLAMHNSILVDAAFAMTSLVAQIFFPAQQSLLLRRFPTRYATVLSCNNSALFIGIALGSIIGGQVLAIGGFTAILPISATVVLTGYAGLNWRQGATSTRDRTVFMTDTQRPTRLPQGQRAIFSLTHAFCRKHSDARL
jgi:predicted MFS family arabinose efflux permease